MTQEEVSNAYLRYRPIVLRRCQVLLRDSAAAEDAVQEVFLRLWRYGDAFRAADSQAAWLCRVAERCCFDKMGKREPLVDDASEMLSWNGAAASVEDREVVGQFLERFDERVQQVALLHYMNDLGQEEIARATGWSRQTITKKLELLRTTARKLRSSFGLSALVWGTAAILGATALSQLALETEPQLRGGTVSVHRKRGEDVRVLGSSDRIAAGDRLRIVFTNERKATAAAWFRDANGHLDRVAVLELGAGEHALPGSVVVDAPCSDLLLITATNVTPEIEASVQRGDLSNTHQRLFRCE